MNNKYFSLPPIDFRKSKRNLADGKEERRKKNRSRHPSTLCALRTRKLFPSTPRTDMALISQEDSSKDSKSHQESKIKLFSPVVRIKGCYNQSDSQDNSRKMSSGSLTTGTNESTERLYGSDRDVSSKSWHVETFRGDGKIVMTSRGDEKEKRFSETDDEVNDNSVQMLSGRTDENVLLTQMTTTLCRRPSRDFNVNAISPSENSYSSKGTKEPLTDASEGETKPPSLKTSKNKLSKEASSEEIPNPEGLNSLETSCQVLENIYKKQKAYAKCTYQCCEMLTFAGCKISHFTQHLQLNCQQLNCCCCSTKELIKQGMDCDKCCAKTMLELRSSASMLNLCSEALNNACRELIDRCKDHVQVSHELHKSCEEQHQICELMKLKLHEQSLSKILPSSQTKQLKNLESLAGARFTSSKEMACGSKIDVDTSKDAQPAGTEARSPEAATVRSAEVINKNESMKNLAGSPSSNNGVCSPAADIYKIKDEALTLNRSVETDIKMQTDLNLDEDICARQCEPPKDERSQNIQKPCSRDEPNPNDAGFKESQKLTEDKKNAPRFLAGYAANVVQSSKACNDCSIFQNTQQEKLHQLLVQLQQLLTNFESMKKRRECDATIAEFCVTLSKGGLLDELEEYMCQVLGNLRDLCSSHHENLGKRMTTLRGKSLPSTSNGFKTLMSTSARKYSPEDDQSRIRSCQPQGNAKESSSNKRLSLPNYLQKDPSVIATSTRKVEGPAADRAVYPNWQAPSMKNVGLSMPTNFKIAKAIRLPCKMIIGMALAGPVLYLVDAEKPGLYAYGSENLQEKGEYIIPILRQPWDLVIIENFLFMSDCYQINIIHRLDLRDRCLMKWKVAEAGIRKLSKTKNNALLVVRYPDSLIEYHTSGELLNEIVVKVEGLELSHALKLDDNKYVVCGTNWCLTNNRVCIIDNQGYVVKCYDQNLNPPSNCDCDNPKCPYGQATYVASENRTNSNSCLQDQRDGYRAASYNHKNNSAIQRPVNREEPLNTRRLNKLATGHPRLGGLHEKGDGNHSRIGNSTGTNHNFGSSKKRTNWIKVKEQERSSAETIGEESFKSNIYCANNSNSDCKNESMGKIDNVRINNCNCSSYSCCSGGPKIEDYIYNDENEEIIIEPIYMALDSEDNILICDYSTNKIILLDCNLNFKKVLVKQGEQFQISSPTAHNLLNQIPECYPEEDADNDLNSCLPNKDNILPGIAQSGGRALNGNVNYESKQRQEYKRSECCPEEKTSYRNPCLASNKNLLSGIPKSGSKGLRLDTKSNHIPNYPGPECYPEEETCNDLNPCLPPNNKFLPEIAQSGSKALYGKVNSKSRQRVEYQGSECCPEEEPRYDLNPCLPPNENSLPGVPQSGSKGLQWNKSEGNRELNYPGPECYPEEEAYNDLNPCLPPNESFLPGIAQSRNRESQEYQGLECYPEESDYDQNPCLPPNDILLPDTTRSFNKPLSGIKKSGFKSIKEYPVSEKEICNNLKPCPPFDDNNLPSYGANLGNAISVKKTFPVHLQPECCPKIQICYDINPYIPVNEMFSSGNENRECEVSFADDTSPRNRPFQEYPRPECCPIIKICYDLPSYSPDCQKNVQDDASRLDYPSYPDNWQCSTPVEEDQPNCTSFPDQRSDNRNFQEDQQECYPEEFSHDSNLYDPPDANCIPECAPQPCDTSFQDTQNGCFQETQNDCFQDTQNECFQDTQNECFQDTQNECFQDTQNECFQDTQNECFQDTQNECFQDTQNECFQDTQNECFQDTQNECFQDTQNECFQEAQNDCFQDSQNDCFRDTRNDGFQDSQNDCFQDTQNGGFQDSQNDGFQYTQNYGFQESQNDCFQESQNDCFQDTQTSCFPDTRNGCLQRLPECYPQGKIYSELEPCFPSGDEACPDLKPCFLDGDASSAGCTSFENKQLEKNKPCLPTPCKPHRKSTANKIFPAVKSKEKPCAYDLKPQNSGKYKSRSSQTRPQRKCQSENKSRTDKCLVPKSPSKCGQNKTRIPYIAANKSSECRHVYQKNVIKAQKNLICESMKQFGGTKQFRTSLTERRAMEQTDEYTKSLNSTVGRFMLSEQNECCTDFQTAVGYPVDCDRLAESLGEYQSPPHQQEYCYSEFSINNNNRSNDVKTQSHQNHIEANDIKKNAKCPTQENHPSAPARVPSTSDRNRVHRCCCNKNRSAISGNAAAETAMEALEASPGANSGLFCQSCSTFSCPETFKNPCETEAEEDSEEFQECYRKSSFCSNKPELAGERTGMIQKCGGAQQYNLMTSAPVSLERPYRLCLDEGKRLLYVASSSVYNGNQLIVYKY